MRAAISMLLLFAVVTGAFAQTAAERVEIVQLASRLPAGDQARVANLLPQLDADQRVQLREMLAQRSAAQEFPTLGGVAMAAGLLGGMFVPMSGAVASAANLTYQLAGFVPGPVLVVGAAVTTGVLAYWAYKAWQGRQEFDRQLALLSASAGSSREEVVFRRPSTGHAAIDRSDPDPFSGINLR